MIRVATPADAAAIARVHVATWRVAYAGLVPDAFLAGLSVPANASRWESLLADPRRRVWVAGGAEPSGFAAAGPARDADLPESSGELYALYVLPSAQRRGTGRALAEAALAWWEPTGRSVSVWTLTDNAAARAFYAATGWVPDGAERESDIGGALVREVRYRRSVSPGSAT